MQRTKSFSWFCRRASSSCSRQTTWIHSHKIRSSYTVLSSMRVSSERNIKTRDKFFRGFVWQLISLVMLPSAHRSADPKSAFPSCYRLLVHRAPLLCFCSTIMLFQLGFFTLNARCAHFATKWKCSERPRFVSHAVSGGRLRMELKCRNWENI